MGITYYKRISEYDGDRTKDCGLTGAELDNNFYFLRGYDIDSITFDADYQLLTLYRVDGSKLEVELKGGQIDIHELVERLEAEERNREAGDNALAEQISDLSNELNAANEKITELENKVKELEKIVSGITEDKLIKLMKKTIADTVKGWPQNIAVRWFDEHDNPIKDKTEEGAIDKVNRIKIKFAKDAIFMADLEDED